MLEKHSDSGEFDEGRSGSCNEEGDDSDDEATSANGSRSSLGDDVTHSVPGVGISPENFDPSVSFYNLIYFLKIHGIMKFIYQLFRLDVHWIIHYNFCNVCIL